MEKKILEFNEDEESEVFVGEERELMGVDLGSAPDKTVMTSIEVGETGNTVVSSEEVKTIDNVVDMPIVKFINFLQGKSFATVNILGKQLEISLGEVLGVRASVERARGQMTAEQMEKAHSTFISTFIVEREIQNKIDILKSIQKFKGIKFPQID